MRKKTATCPKDDSFQRAFLHELSDEEKETFLDHVFACPTCRLKFEALKSLDRELREKGGEISGAALSSAERKAFLKMSAVRFREIKNEVRKKGKPAFSDFPHRLGTRPVIVISCLILMVLAGYFIFSRYEAYREGKGGRLQLIEPKGTVKDPPTVFSWKAYKNAEVYIFKLIDEDLQTLEIEHIKTTSYVLDETAKRKLEKEKNYIWTVEAQDNDLNRLAVAQERFIIKYPSP